MQIITEQLPVIQFLCHDIAWCLGAADALLQWLLLLLLLLLLGLLHRKIRQPFPSHPQPAHQLIVSLISSPQEGFELLVT